MNKSDIKTEVFEVGTRVERIIETPGESGKSVEYELYSDGASKINIPAEANKLKVTHCGLKELGVPGRIYMVDLWRNNNLEKVTIADSNNHVGCTHVYASHNENLKELKLGKGVDIAVFPQNNLESVEIPEGCQKVDATGNQIKKLDLPKSCKYVNVSSNPIEEINVPEGCKYVYANYTDIKEIHIPKGCAVFECKGTNLDFTKSSIHPDFKGKIDGIDEYDVDKLKANYGKKPNQGQQTVKLKDTSRDDR